MRSDQFINLNEALQAHPEYLNDQHEDHDKATYAKGWNACNSRYFGELGNLKTVDVIRCQDCKWYQYGKHFTETKFCSRLKDKDGNQVYYNFSPDDFCSHGERRNNNDLPDEEINIHSADIETLLDEFQDSFTKYCDYANRADSIEWSQEKEDEAYAHYYEIREEIISRYEKGEI